MRDASAGQQLAYRNVRSDDRLLISPAFGSVLRLSESRPLARHNLNPGYFFGASAVGTGGSGSVVGEKASS